MSDGSKFLETAGTALANYATGGLVGLGVDLFKGLFGSDEKSNSKELAKYQSELNMQMASQQNQWNIDQWNRQNEYNSPSAQLSRYQDAGINPLFASIDGGAAGSLTSADMKAGDVAQSMSALASLKSYQMQEMLMSAQARDLNASAHLKEKQAHKTDSETTGIDIDNKFKPMLLEGQIHLQNADITLKDKTVKLTDEQVRKVFAETKNINESVLCACFSLRCADAFKSLA